MYDLTYWIIFLTAALAISISPVPDSIYILSRTISYGKRYFELAIDLPCFAEVDQEFQRVVLLGAQPIFNPRNEPWGMRSSFVADPEGNLIEIGSWG